MGKYHQMVYLCLKRKERFSMSTMENSDATHRIKAPIHQLLSRESDQLNFTQSAAHETR